MIYFDTSYIVRLYWADPGWMTVRELAATDHVACCLHGRVETIAALHRKYRDGHASSKTFRILMEQFEEDCNHGGFTWLPYSPVLVSRLAAQYLAASPKIFLRTGDAIHLACAALNGFQAIYSNDVHLLKAAPHFGIKGLDVI
ncbi:MAG: type II toxin-antitoxin system VapC family toxin [Verrucomicrobiae bacterium]|nr:type II toxin-antitoxin system VapC family toxin [Verrucomicrobiae bacterium]